MHTYFQQEERDKHKVGLKSNPHSCRLESNTSYMNKTTTNLRLKTDTNNSSMNSSP